MLAKDIMTQNIIALKPESTIDEAVDVLVNNKISGAPVLDDQGDLVGIVTEKDLMVSWDFLGENKGAYTPVKNFMTTEAITVSENTPVVEISRLLVNRNIKRVPVVRERKVVGIVARRDILKIMRQTNS